MHATPTRHQYLSESLGARVSDDLGRNPRIGMHGKSEKIMPADPARRLVIEWTAQLPEGRRNAAAR